MLRMIVAHCRNKGIGIGYQLPFKLKYDMYRFKKITMGDRNNAIIMGKNTWLSMSKRPLSHRDNLILSRTLKGEHIFNSVKDIKQHCHQKGYDDIWIIGGEDIYKQFIWDGDLETIYVTEIDERGDDCDIFFPNIPTWFKVLWRSEDYMDNNTSFRYVVYKRSVDFSNINISWSSSHFLSSTVHLDYR